jgi:hypothetical protein
MNRAATVFSVGGLVAGLLCAQDPGTEELLKAARNDDVAAVTALLEKGVNVNAKAPTGATALFYACDRGDAGLVKLLIDCGADVNVVDSAYHASALAWAMQKNNLDIMRLLLEHGAKSPGEVLKAGVRNGNIDWIKLALSIKGGVDKASMSSAMAAATKMGKQDIAMMLDESGAVMRPTVRLDETVLSSYAGKYGAMSNGMQLEFTFELVNGELRGLLKPQPWMAFVPTDATHFVNDEFGVEAEFQVEKGAVAGFKFTQGGVTIDFKRKGESQ